MSGLQEFNSKYIRRINNVLKNQPTYIKGFVSYLNDVSLTTKYTYLNDVVNFMKVINKPVSELTLDDFAMYISDLEYKEDGKRVTSSYRIAVYSALKRFSDYLFRNKKIKEDCMLNVKRPKPVVSQETIRKRKKGFLTIDEMSELIKSVEDGIYSDPRKINNVWNKRDMLIIKIFLSTGIRCSALHKLDISSIDFKTNKIFVTDKGDKVNDFDLTDDLMDDIKEWLAIRKEKINDNDPALFISNRRTRIDQTSISNIVKKYSKCIEDKHITPHKLRATYGTLLYDQTKDIYFVQSCMGHSNPKTTELYVRGISRDTKKASSIVGGFINN